MLRLEAFLAGLKCWILALEGLLALDDGAPSRAGETGPGSVRRRPVAQLESGCWCVIN